MVLRGLFGVGRGGGSVPERNEIRRDIVMFWKLKCDQVAYCQFDGFVIRAKSEQDARQIAKMYCKSGDTLDWSDGAIWLDFEISSCDPIQINGNSGVILGSFKE